MMSPVCSHGIRTPDSRRPPHRRLAAFAWALLIGAGMPAFQGACSSGQETSPKGPVTGGAEDPGSAADGRELRVGNGKPGRPEPGVTIAAPRGDGLTDEQGRYRIRWVGARPAHLSFNVRKPGFVRLQLNWDNANPAGPVAIPREYT